MLLEDFADKKTEPDNDIYSSAFGKSKEEGADDE